MKRILSLLTFLLATSCYATNTVTAVSLITGNMSTVTIHSSTDTAIYSHCSNLTPYTYRWTVSDIVNVSVNFGSTAWTLNDLSSSALAVCIVRTVIQLIHLPMAEGAEPTLCVGSFTSLMITISYPIDNHQYTFIQYIYNVAKRQPGRFFAAILHCQIYGDTDKSRTKGDV